jgi:AcrR family transcriptional regulator
MGATRPMRADARRNYDQLLVRAADAFSEHGIEASLEDIARSAGVGIGTLYRHFPTREALLEALMAERFDRYRARADALMTAADPMAALRSWLRLFIEGSAAYRGLPASVAATLTDPASRLYASCHAMQNGAAELVGRAQDAGLVRTNIGPSDVFLMAAAISWAGEQVTDDPTDRLLDLLLDGLRVRRPTGSE